MLVRTILVIAFGITSFLLLLCGFLVTSALGLSESSEQRDAATAKKLFLFLIVWGIFLIGGAIAPLFIIEPLVRISQVLIGLAIYGLASIGGIAIYVILAPISRFFNRR